MLACPPLVLAFMSGLLCCERAAAQRQALSRALWSDLPYGLCQRVPVALDSESGSLTARQPWQAACGASRLLSTEVIDARLRDARSPTRSCRRECGARCVSCAEEAPGPLPFSTTTRCTGSPVAKHLRSRKGLQHAAPQPVSAGIANPTVPALSAATRAAQESSSVHLIL